jgi:hypothetical protein
MTEGWAKPKTSFKVIPESHIPNLHQSTIQLGSMEIDSKSKCSFLELPYHIRLKIYKYTDLPLDQEISIPWADSDRAYDLLGHDVVIQSYLNLIYTCHQIYNEVLPLYYKANRFFVTDGSQFSLLPARIISEMRNVLFVVYLNTYAGLGKCCSPQVWTRLDTIAEQVADQLAGASDWIKAIERIFEFMTPHQLTLHVICDEDVLAENNLLLEQVLSLFIHPLPLRNLSIRLGEKNEGLEKLAQNALQSAVPHLLHSHETPFQFMDLPSELRLQILEYTDLVAPFTEIQWNAGDETFSTCSNSRYPASDFRMVCTKIGRCYSNCQGDDCPHHEGMGCFCKRQHSVASSKQSCICWEPPINLFLVSKAMNREASLVFFSQNRFFIGDFKSADDDAIYDGDYVNVTFHTK